MVAEFALVNPSILSLWLSIIYICVYILTRASLNEILKSVAK